MYYVVRTTRFPEFCIVHQITSPHNMYANWGGAFVVVPDICDSSDICQKYIIRNILGKFQSMQYVCHDIAAVQMSHHDQL
jgi:hypothetical protein